MREEGCLGLMNLQLEQHGKRLVAVEVRSVIQKV